MLSSQGSAWAHGGETAVQLAGTMPRSQKAGQTADFALAFEIRCLDLLQALISSLAGHSQCRCNSVSGALLQRGHSEFASGYSSAILALGQAETTEQQSTAPCCS